MRLHVPNALLRFHFARVALIGSVIAACVAVAPLAQAQVQTVMPPVFSAIDHLGVDASTGQFHLSTGEVVIGQSGAGGIAFGRSWVGSGWRDSLAGTINSSGSVYTVSIGAAAETFTWSGSAFTSDQWLGSTLTFNSGNNEYTYTMRDGSVAIFDKDMRSFPWVSHFWESNEGSIASLTRPDGEVLTWTYTLATPLGGYSAWRPQSISNNLGYQIHFTYSLDSPANAGDFPAFLTRTKVTGINRSVYNCSDSAFTCSDSSGANWPYVTYGSESGGIETVTDRLSQTTRFAFVGGNLTEVRLPTSSSVARTSISYSSGKVEAVSGNVGGWFSTTYSYSDASGVRTTTATPYFEGNPSITKTNLANGWVTELWADGSGTRKTVLTRDSHGRITRTTRADGGYTDLTYDDRGNVTQIVEAPKTSTGLSSITTSASYPGSCSNAKTCNKPNSTTDARGFRTDYIYSATHGGVESIKLPNPSGTAPADTGVRPETRFAYGDAGTGILRVTATSSCATGSSCASAANETVQTFNYDAQRRLITSTIRAGDWSVYEISNLTYTPQGDVATVDGPFSGTGDTSYLYYDDVRRLRASVSPDPDSGGSLQHRVSRTTYNADGFPTIVEVGHVSSPSSWASMTVLQRVDNTYELGLPIPFSKTALSSGGTTYAVQQFSVREDLFARCTATRMNPSEFASLPTGTYAACQADTGGSYGPDRFSITNYNGYREGTSVADGTVDAYGAPSRLTQTVSYDSSSGESEYLTDADGNETKYEYDGYSRLVKTIFPSTTTPGDQNTGDYEQLTYDAYGRMTARRGRDGQSFSFSYDNLGRVTAIDAPGSQPDISYTYDNFGRVLTAAQSGHTLTYVYDALSRLTSETQASRTVSYQYDAAGRRSRLTWPDSFYVTYEYNTVGEVTAIKENGGSALATFTYDNLGRRTSLARGNGSTTGYAFDGGSRLIDLGLDLGGSSHDVWTDLAYNPASQIVSRTINNTGYNFTQPSAYADTYTDNGLNQYTSAGGATPTYDSRGNTTYDGAKSYTYDYSNRMLTAGSATLSYDPAGRLYQVAGGATVRFLYDGVDMIAEYDTSGNVLRRYVHGPGIDEPLVWFEGAGHSGSGSPDRRYLFADERGSIIAVEGGSTTKNAYDEYGVPGSGNAGRFQYTGQIWLADVGLYHYKARFYSPELGRFMQTDPIGYGDGMNMYGYVSADPINNSDPSGLNGRIVVTAVRETPNPGWEVVDCGEDPQLCRALAAIFGSGGVEPSFETPIDELDPDRDRVVVTGKRPTPRRWGAYRVQGGKDPSCVAGWTGGGMAAGGLGGGLLGAGGGGAACSVTGPGAAACAGGGWQAGAAGGTLVGGAVGSTLGNMFCPDVAPPVALRPWSCTASCNIENFSRIPGAPGRVTGFATGPNEVQACLNAKRVATQSAPRGTYARHCQCSCSN